jgi:hypothetical protein
VPARAADLELSLSAHDSDVHSGRPPRGGAGPARISYKGGVRRFGKTFMAVGMKDPVLGPPVILATLEQLSHGEPDIFGDLPQENWRDVAVGVKWDSCGTTSTVAKLPSAPLLTASQPARFRP